MAENNNVDINETAIPEQSGDNVLEQSTGDKYRPGEVKDDVQKDQATETEVESQEQPDTGDKGEKADVPSDSGQQDSRETLGLSHEQYQKVMNDPLLSKAYKSMQAGLTKKTQALKEQTGDEKRRSFAEIVQDPAYQNEIAEFIQQSAPTEDMSDSEQQTMSQIVRNWNKLDSKMRNKYMDNLNDEQKTVVMTAVQTQNLQRQEAQRQMQVEDERNKEKYGQSYEEKLPDVNKFFVNLSNRKAKLSADMVYKMLNYDNYGQAMYEKGKRERTKTQENANNANLNSSSGTLGHQGKMSSTQAMGAALERMGITD